jgi:hypothetical protein
MSRFEAAAQRITGDSWLDELARQSLASAEKRFAPTAAPGQTQTRVEWTGRIQVHQPIKPRKTQ